MHRRAATDADAYRGDLGVADPYAGGLVSRRCADAEFGQRRDDDLFQRADVRERAQSRRSQVEYRIAHDLSRPVVGRFPASVRVVHVGIEFPERLIGREYVRLASTSAQGVHVRVFEQQEQRRKIAARHPPVKVSLERERGGVVK